MSVCDAKNESRLISTAAKHVELVQGDFMKKMLLIALIGVLVGAFLPLPSASADRGVVERAVSFEVIHQNRTRTTPLCQGDGKTYTLRGSLVGPAGVQAGRIDSVTLYLGGGGDVSAWHFTAAPGVDHITEMARLGHASVSLHLLGYKSSDPVDGNTLCYAAWADQVQQVIDQLRAGSYTMAGRARPAFERVALAGHSNGAPVAELATVSFHGADALIVQGWTDYPWMGTLPAGVDEGVDSPHPFPYRTIAGFVRRCVTAPESKPPGGPGGWAYLFTTRAEFELVVHDIDPDVVEALIEMYEQDPCTTLDSLPAVLASNNALAPTVDGPVQLANGDRDPFASPTQIEVQRARYELGSDDVSSVIVPATAHLPMLERTAPMFRAELSSWLKARGF